MEKYWVPVFANILMEWLEQKAIETSSQIKYMIQICQQYVYAMVTWTREVKAMPTPY